MSASATMVVIREREQAVTSNGELLAEWLHDPVAARARSHGLYTLENADDYLDQEAVELYNGWLVWQAMTDIKERMVVGTIQGMLSLSARGIGFG